MKRTKTLLTTLKILFKLPVAIAAVVFLIGTSTNRSYALPINLSELTNLYELPQASATLSAAHPEIPSEAINNALMGYYTTKHLLAIHQYLTIIDFSASSRTKRMHIINMYTGESTRYLVAHGVNSGWDFAKSFSNVDGTFKSSVGFFMTMHTYDGQHGLSLKLKGLNEGLNDNAYDRGIVIHGADYVSDTVAKSQDRLGRSQGCPAVDLKHSDKIIHAIKGGSLIYIYSNI